MANKQRQKGAVQVNQFVGGLNTEANPLSYPPNNSIDEVNMELAYDGSRYRRGGMQPEEDFMVVNTDIELRPVDQLGRSQHRWTNPGNNPGQQFMVVQLGNYLAVHDLSVAPLSSGKLWDYTFDTSVYASTFTYATVDGSLVVATGEADVLVVSFEENVFEATKQSLQIRDFFGVSSTISSVELTEPQNFTKRPTSKTDAHIYNLRNQTFGRSLLEGDADTSNIIDPITEFFGYASAYPSNADNLVQFMAAEATFSTNRTAERFNAKSMQSTRPASSRAPLGFFIIDPIRRGASRLAQIASMQASDTNLGHSVSVLPVDETVGGPTVVTQYAGRVWFAGFPSEVIGGDAESPKLTSYVLFSQIVQSTPQLTRCYQKSDPTSSTDPDVVADDGGYIKIEGASNINKLVPMAGVVFVFAENGVWKISGGDDSSFSAESYVVEQVTDVGCVRGSSVVVSEQSLAYWAEAGIFGVERNQYGLWGASNLSKGTIQTYYKTITAIDRGTCVGYYSPETESIRWIFGGMSLGGSSPKELSLDTKYAAFTKNDISLVDGTQGPISMTGGQTVPATGSVDITSEGEVVTSEGENVFIKKNPTSLNPSQSFYLIFLGTSPTLTYTFGGYDETTVKDWERLDGVGVDSPAYLVTGTVNGGDARLRKDVPYLTCFFANTSDFAEDSSCILRAQWNWTTSALSGKWTSPKEAYRAISRREGDRFVVTRNKIRGNGRAIAFRFDSSPGQKMHIYGWEFNLEATGQE